ncbi:sulfatase-like hydrolase/transferase [Thermostichus vulcanus]|uniref:Sulfatase-like hydrolase/transferase n=1 Tax=Thermostichus vulcanus str. 'Rupite' TaxID=2813851 RepID=A0ABT0CDB5_THEVL|nr:sulfatase-like hydrolase/transferase [Thermostichus vulcanus]MCJ2543765.1 sulfatase-like hydrolase/transferase [Thermostichus vulcanus str. 'Rupite']
MGLLNWLKAPAAVTTEPTELANPLAEPAPLPTPQGQNNYLLIILDSCRFDSLLAANPKHLLKLGSLEKRWSYASWTAPSHYNLLMGLLPHTSPTQVFASEHYKQDYLRYNERLGTRQPIEFKHLLPHLYLPTLLKHQLGYLTHAMVSLPVLNPSTVLNRDFDSYHLMPQHNDMAAMVEQLHFEPDRPSFYLLNVGETHYPYALPDQDPSLWPRISGVNGVLKRLDEPTEEGIPFFDSTQLEELRQRQIEAVRYLDGIFEQLFDLVPPNTYITVTADHGELFGEEGYFGHGPIHHEKVLEVPFIEGKIR